MNAEEENRGLGLGAFWVQHLLDWLLSAEMVLMHGSRVQLPTTFTILLWHF